MTIISLVLFALGLILGLYTSRIRDGLARIIMMIWDPFYKPGEGTRRRTIEWACTHDRVRRLLGAS